jgi:S-adenosylhomocysteine hydrolase
LNGIPVSKEIIQYLPMPDIDFIDVFKSIGETAMLGITPANGVIAVYPKRGMSDEEYNADHRITLYWNPNIVSENGKATVSFFTSDDLSDYKLFVEGITNTGEICLGTAAFDVNQRNELIKEKE